MRSSHFPCLLIALALLVLPALSGARAQTTGGQQVERIYLGAKAGEDVRVAADELNHHLEKASGRALELIRTDDPGAVDGPAIVLGELAVRMGAGPQEASESKEGFRLLTRDDLVLVGGESDAGTLFGVYELLEKLGFDWVMPGEIGEIVPAGPLAIPPLDESQAPDFAMRRLWYRGGRKLIAAEEQARLDIWLRRQKGGSYQTVAAQTSGHYWPKFIRKHKAEFDRDPTLFALRRHPDGSVRRGGPQLESTDPRIARWMANDIRDAFAEHGWPKDKAVGFPIGSADGGNYSISPEAMAVGSGEVDPATGELDQTDHLVRLANAVLAELGPEFPNVHVGFYSYGAHGGYPRRFKPDPRVAVVFAPINFSRYHALTDAASRTQPLYKGVLDQWAALNREQGNPMLYRGYNWNLAENMLPYSKLLIWGEELPYYREAGVSGLNVEATKAWGVNGPSDWLFMKLAWNASQDWRALLDDYCRKSFGAGAAPMQRYLLRLVETQRAAGQEAGSYHAIPLIFDRAFVAAARADLAEAIALATTQADKARIGYFAPSIELLAGYLDYWEAANSFDFASALASYGALHETWQQAHALNSDIAAAEGPQYLERYIGPFLRAATAFSSGDHRIVERLPDTMETAFAAAGEELPPGDGWEPTRTFSSTWDAQRVSAADDRAAWYRHGFAASERPLFLFLGSFNDEATVWVNGQRIGSSGRQFSKPVVFDLTPALQPDENTIAIRIVRNQSLNELGVGGLFRPSFLFTGPKPEGTIGQ